MSLQRVLEHQPPLGQQHPAHHELVDQNNRNDQPQGVDQACTELRGSVDIAYGCEHRQHDGQRQTQRKPQVTEPGQRVAGAGRIILAQHATFRSQDPTEEPGQRNHDDGEEKPAQPAGQCGGIVGRRCNQNKRSRQEHRHQATGFMSQFFGGPRLPSEVDNRESPGLAKYAERDEVKEIQRYFVERSADRRHELAGPYGRLVKMRLEIERIDTAHKL